MTRSIDVTVLRERSLVWVGVLCLVWLSLHVLPQPARAQSMSTGSFGHVIPLPGHINEIILDESRGFVYAGNFSAGRVEVISTTTHQRVSSFLTNPSPSAVSAMAMTPDHRFLVVTNVPVTTTIPRLSGLTVINLNDPGDRRHFPMAEQPLTLAFGADSEALVVTQRKLQLFNPVDGSFVEIFDLEDPPGDVVLPVPSPTFPREIVKAHATASRDGRYIYGVTETFVFSYEIAGRLGFLMIRPNDTLVSAPLFGQVSAADDGGYFMAGQLLFNNRLSVMADTPEAPEDDADGLFGGHVIDSAIDTVYAVFNTPASTGPPGRQPGSVLNVMDADNLHVRRRIQVPEQVQGRLLVSDDGRHLYATSESGVTYLPLDDLNSEPQVEVRAEDRDLLFQFDFCSQRPQTKILRIESPGGAPAGFSLRATFSNGTPAPGISFEPSQGVTPAEVRVTVFPDSLPPVDGTVPFDVIVDSDAVNVPAVAKLLVNVQDLDQKGRFHAVAGNFVDVISDPNRDRFYVLDQESFQVHMFDSESFRLLGSFRTGNTPTWMTIGNFGTFLIVANSRAETLTLIDLNQNRKFGDIQMFWINLAEGFYPVSVATDNANVLIAAETAEGNGKIARLLLPFRGISSPVTLGIFENDISTATALVPLTNGAGIMLAQSDGRTALWETQTSRLVLARQDFPSLGGAVGAGDDFFVVQDQLLNQSLVPQLSFDDASAGQAPSGFALMPDGMAVRSTRPASGNGSGLLQRFDTRDPNILLNSVRMVEAPPPPFSEEFPFTRTLAALRNGKLVSTGTAGIVEFVRGFDTNLRTPRVSAITNPANFKTDAATGGLITIFGENLAEESVSAETTPLPTTLGGTCVSMNGLSLPLLYVSATQINAQASFALGGGISTIVHTPGGLSDIFLSSLAATAPAVFSITGPDNGVHAAVFRLKNNQISTLSNPFRHNEVGVIFLTGMGGVTPLVLDGFPAPASPLSVTTAEPTVTVGGARATVLYSGLVPGFVALYQINFLIPPGAPFGLQIPVTVSAGQVTETFFVRIVE